MWIQNLVLVKDTVVIASPLPMKSYDLRLLFDPYLNLLCLSPVVSIDCSVDGGSNFGVSVPPSGAFFTSETLSVSVVHFIAGVNSK